MSTRWMRMAAVCLFAGALAAPAQDKVGVVDAQKAVKQYYKAQTAIESLKKLDDELRDAQRRMVAKLTDLQEEARKAILEADDKALSDAARAKKREAAEEKLADLREFELQVRKADVDNRRRMEEQNALMQEPIFQDLRKVVADLAREKGLSLVVNSTEAAGSVLFCEPKLDLTDAVIEKLNAGAPAKPAAKP